MNQKLRFLFTMLLLTFVSSSTIWAGESIVYNFAFVQNTSASNYNSIYNVTIGGKAWSIPGNLNIGDFLRIGGKGISEVNREIKCNEPLSGTINRITFNHNGKSRNSITVHSVKLVVANNADFSNEVDAVTIEPTIETTTAGSFNFVPTSGVSWNGDLYYKFIVNVSNSNSSNAGGLDLTSLVFYQTVQGAIDPTVSFENESEEIEIGETVTNTLNKPDDLTVNYSSNKTSIATVDENGVVTGIAEGEATITASWDAVTNKYNAGSVSYVVTVKPVAVSVNFVKVTNANQLVAGNEYILVGSNNGSYAAMGARTGTNTYRERVEVAVEDDKVGVKENQGIAILTLGGKSGEWTFLASDNNEYLALTTSGNALYSATDPTLKTSQWEITNDFQLISAKFSDRYLQYNSTNTRFACYTNTQNPSYLFVKEGSPINDKPEPPSFTPAGGAVKAGTTVSITIPEGVDRIEYSYDENNWTTSNATVSIDINEETTIYARSIKGEKESDVVSVTYTIIPETQVVFVEPNKTTFDLTINEWGFPEGSSNITDDEQEFSANGKTLKVVGSPGYYFNTNGFLLMGKEGAYLTLPAFDFDVSKIDVVGTSGASEYVKQNIFVKGTAVSTETTGARNVTNSYEINTDYQEAGTIYTLKVTSAHNTQITKIIVYKKDEPYKLTINSLATDGENYYATVSNLGNGGFVVPDGLEVSAITIVNNKINKTKTWTEGNVIPGDKAYYVVANNSGDFTFQPSTTTSSFTEDNWLYPATAGPMMTSDTNYLYYKLTLDANNTANSVGFYWGEDDGVPFTITDDHKAYLAVPQSNSAGLSSIVIGEFTGISDIQSAKEQIDEVYTLSGVRVKGNLSKGIYIVNGKKHIIK